MAREQPKYSGDDADNSVPEKDRADVMTVRDYAREAKVSPSLLAGFLSTLTSQSGLHWRTRGEWKTVLETFANAPA
ncbi:MAG: hypothetical protein Q7U76_13075 [Nitrospirota bacterium]|nr:hypothetical protein [Nitrospirota bacterium]